MISIRNIAQARKLPTTKAYEATATAVRFGDRYNEFGCEKFTLTLKPKADITRIIGTDNNEEK